MEQDERQVQIGAGDITLLMPHAPVRFTGRSLLNRFHYFATHSAGTIFSPSKTCLRRKMDADLPMVQLSHRLLQESMNIRHFLKQKVKLRYRRWCVCWPGTSSAGICSTSS